MRWVVRLIDKLAHTLLHIDPTATQPKPLGDDRRVARGNHYAVARKRHGRGAGRRRTVFQATSQAQPVS